MKKNKIFISIASYRDSELIPTIEDCIKNAKMPQNLVFAISRQYHPDDGFDDLTKYKKDKRFKIIETLWSKSVGVCNARHTIQKLYDDEEFYFQLDSHHRFIKDWDFKIKKTFRSLIKKGHKKPIISSYLPSYDPDTSSKNEDKLNDVWRTYIDRFMPEGPIFIFPESIEDKKAEPEAARFLSGHFLFSQGNFVKEVPYDPHLYFHGEESSLAVRAFTHGYDLFHLHRPWFWHHYTRAKGSRHWDDVAKWEELNNKSFLRFKELLGVDGIRRKHFPKYGLGKVRSLVDYERYAGIKFKDRRVHQDTYDRKVPPIKFIKDKKKYDAKFVSKFKYCIDIHKPAFTEKDYDVWVVAFKDKNGKELVRLDADENELNNLMLNDPSDDFVRMWRDFNTSVIPKKWLVWPHSKEKGWMEIIEGEIPHI